jgi:putative SOS response-associated peptidase YedK
MINARSETLAEKPMFRSAVRRRRCLIPVDGFYEWQQSAVGSRGKKQPYFIHRPDDGPFAFAGLWETWTQGKEVDASLTIESCVIVTTEANATLRELHERMPVVLAPGEYSQWLDSKVDDPVALKHLMAPLGPHPGLSLLRPAFRSREPDHGLRS